MAPMDLSVEEYTTPNPVTATEDMTVDQLQTLMKENGIRHLPVVRGKQVVGVISERDLKVVMGLDFKEKSIVRASDIMAREPVTVPIDATLGQVAMEMSKRKIGSVIVTEGDEMYGIFTATDALNALIEVLREDVPTHNA